MCMVSSQGCPAQPRGFGSACEVARGGRVSGDTPAEPRRQNTELLSVLRHRAAGDAQALQVEELGDALVRERIRLVLLVDERLDDVLGGTRRDVLAVLRLETAREE